MTQAQQYMSALVSLELAVKFAQLEGRKVNATIKATCKALQERITDEKVLRIIRGLAKQPFPDGALKMMRRQLDTIVSKP